jgi:ribosomal protein S18 acetylase RimI-like enzyme
MVDVAKPSRTDVEWLLCHDPHVGEPWVLRCIDLGEYFVARIQGDIVGFLRFSLFWGRIPYMEMIWVSSAHRRSGVGTALFRMWEDEMRRDAYGMLMTSSEADEPEPQDWHRRNGFSETGAIKLPSIQSVPEVFFLKQVA